MGCGGKVPSCTNGSAHCLVWKQHRLLQLKVKQSAVRQDIVLYTPFSIPPRCLPSSNPTFGKMPYSVPMFRCHRVCSCGTRHLSQSDRTGKKLAFACENRRLHRHFKSMLGVWLGSILKKALKQVGNVDNRRPAGITKGDHRLF